MEGKLGDEERRDSLELLNKIDACFRVRWLGRNFKSRLILEVLVSRGTRVA